jgi:hypothetical protein
MVNVTASLLVLTAALLSWKSDIEARAGARLLVAEVLHQAERNEFTLPEDTPGRELFVEYLKQDQFMRQFSQMYAVMIHHKSPAGGAYLILLNGAKRSEWETHQEALLAHEFGHAWLKAQGFPAPILVNNQWACVGIHTGDITQHVLIRAELDRRRIPHHAFWFRTMEQAIEQMEKGPPPPESDRCARVRQAAQLVDVRLGLKPGQWPAQDRYEAAARRWMPEVESTAAAIVAYLQAHDMADRAQHRAALQFVFEKLKDLAYQKSNEYRVCATLELCSRLA